MQKKQDEKFKMLCQYSFETLANETAMYQLAVDVRRQRSDHMGNWKSSQGSTAVQNVLTQYVRQPQEHHERQLSDKWYHLVSTSTRRHISSLAGKKAYVDK